MRWPHCAPLRPMRVATFPNAIIFWKTGGGHRGDGTHRSSTPSSAVLTPTGFFWSITASAAKRFRYGPVSDGNHGLGIRMQLAPNVGGWDKTEVLDGLLEWRFSARTEVQDLHDAIVN
ncbi:MAG: hypothetical protein ABI240_09595 [Sphingomonas sp.]